MARPPCQPCWCWPWTVPSRAFSPKSFDSNAPSSSLFLSACPALLVPTAVRSGRTRAARRCTHSALSSRLSCDLRARVRSRETLVAVVDAFLDLSTTYKSYTYKSYEGVPDHPPHLSRRLSQLLPFCSFSFLLTFLSAQPQESRLQYSRTRMQARIRSGYEGW